MPSTPDNAKWSGLRWTLYLALLTLLTLAIHGFHPLAEDGGLYVAGVKWLLNPALFPHDTAFVSEHLRFSLFAPCIAALVRITHIPLLWTLFALYLASIAATLSSARMILRRLGESERATLCAVALLAACWTMPIAGTSLLLMDPYVTARSLSTPLALFALAWSLDSWRERPGSLCACLLTLAAAAAFHPLMAGYGLAMVLAVRIARMQHPWKGWLALATLTLAGATILQANAPPEPAAELLAAYSRYYWFLSQWQWFELFGLAGPIVVLLLLRRRKTDPARRNALVHATIGLALLSTLVAVLFAREHFAAHVVARLQPLRAFLEVYAIMLLFLGATLADIGATTSRPLIHLLPPAIILGAAIGFFLVARQTFPSSHQVEWPWAADRPANPWAQAFIWARHNTPPDALFAMDAKYVNTDGEDAQVFRATSERSTLPDFSKDGGEAAITPALAGAWQRGAAAQKNLSLLNDADRDGRLQPLNVDWMILHTNAKTAHACPYQNAAIKICRLR